ncbi:MAG: hypothetical protein J7J01_00925 [Methanophagales archaeon]|nr:hypothetical protein [Methanophagales archaeon]
MCILSYLSGFLTGVAITCAAYSIYLHGLRKEMRKVIESIEELVGELRSERK